MIALLLAEQIGVLFLMMAGGFVLVKTGLVKSEEYSTWNAWIVTHGSIR